RDGVLRNQDLYVLDDEQFFALPQTLDFEPLELFSQVRNNALLSCRFEEPFDSGRNLDKICTSLDGRMQAEEQLFRNLQAKHGYGNLKNHEVIIDIPEPIFFESDILLIKEDDSEIPFNQYDTLFTQDVGRVFTKSLRKTRIFTPSYVSRQAVYEALEF
ncbi:MAG: phosphohydrolase, partial [Sphaerochaeta sp.]